jgi:hypothetical protein
MEIRVNVPDELVAQAESRGVPVEKYVEEVLAEGMASRPPAPRKPPTPEEVRAWLDDLAQFSDEIPPLPETITREWLYQDHN